MELLLFAKCVLKSIWIAKFLVLRQYAKPVPNPWVAELTIIQREKIPCHVSLGRTPLPFAVRTVVTVRHFVRRLAYTPSAHDSHLTGALTCWYFYPFQICISSFETFLNWEAKTAVAGMPASPISKRAIPSMFCREVNRSW